MRRMRELIDAVIEKFPHDDFFTNLRFSLRQNSQARAYYRAYDRALSYLDVESWNVLREKAILHFPDHRKGQLKQGFFNQLHDAFAYQLLARRGYSAISVLREEQGRKVPDLRFLHGGLAHYCEVKTISVSDVELNRREAEEVFDTSVYGELPQQFFAKLDDTITRAMKQIATHGEAGVVFILVRFDDFTLQFYSRYREQIIAHLDQHPIENVYIKIGQIGGLHISKGSII